MSFATENEPSVGRNWRGTVVLPLLGFLVLGLALVWAAHHPLEQWALLSEFANAFGHALLVAGLLGLTIDGAVKFGIARDTGLAYRSMLRDAFTAIMGYPLSEHIKPDINWFYGQQLLAQNHHQHYVLRRHASTDDLVMLEVEIERRLTNISATTVPVEVSQEIGRSVPGEETELLAFGYTLNGKTFEARPEEIRTTVVDGGGSTASLGEVTLKPDESLNLWFSAREVRHSEDSSVDVFRTTTVDPEVWVDARAFDGELCVGVRFLSRSAKTGDREGGLHKWSLAGNLLPYQPILVHWWKDPVTQSATQATDEHLRLPQPPSPERPAV